MDDNEAFEEGFIKYPLITEKHDMTNTDIELYNIVFDILGDPDFKDNTEVVWIYKDGRLAYPIQQKTNCKVKNFYEYENRRFICRLTLGN